MKKILAILILLMLVVAYMDAANRRAMIKARRNQQQQGGGGPAETNVTSRPTSDLYNVAWTTAPLWSKMNGVTGSDDGDFIVSDSSPIASETFVLDGSTTKDPEASTGHILRFRSAQTAGSADCDINMELRMGYVSEASLGTLIASTNRISTDTTTVTTTLVLSTTEADAITDYTDLSFRGWGAKSGGGSNPTLRFFDVEFEVEAP